MTRKLSLTVDGRNIVVHLHRGDLPDGVGFEGAVAVDSEAMGLSLIRDRLTLVQMSDGRGEAHLVQLVQGEAAPERLNAVLADPARLKIFHFARYDMAMMMRDLGVIPAPVYCTKIASKLARTYTDRHGLKDAVKELLGREVSKEQQSSDWGAENLSDQQLAYAASDVLHLHDLKAKLDAILVREGRTELAQSCFDFLPTRAALDLAGWNEVDIFAHA
ncbi:MAG: ribonuclease D [Hyphomonadaceae bacterium]|nr:ribonuclease D [Hyphomonadaceae bacterium]